MDIFKKHIYFYTITNRLHLFNQFHFIIVFYVVLLYYDQN